MSYFNIKGPSMRITIDNNGSSFIIKEKDGDAAFPEIVLYFWNQVFLMTRELLSSQDGGTLTLSVPPHATAASAELSLNQAPIASEHQAEESPYPAGNHVGGEAVSASCDESHHDAGKIDPSAVALHAEVAQTYGFGAI